MYVLHFSNWFTLKKNLVVPSIKLFSLAEPYIITFVSNSFSESCLLFISIREISKISPKTGLIYKILVTIEI